MATGGTITINGSAANNNLKGVYVSLPGGVTFNTGYILTFTTVDGTVMSYGFNATEMEEGSINEAQVEWTNPTVTLGAKTTYSYASADPADPATANSMGGGAANGSGTTIFFNETYKSSFSNVQNAMIEDCGFIVDGTTYSAKAGQVTRNGKDFWMNDLKNQSKANHTVQAFIKIKHNANIVYSAAQTLSVTGIPYSVTFTDSTPSEWTIAGNYEWEGYGWNKGDSAKYLRLRWNSYAISPKFHLPGNNNLMVKSTTDCYYYHSTTDKSAIIYINESGDSKPSATTNGTSIKTNAFFNNFNAIADIETNLTLTNSSKRLAITHNITSQDKGPLLNSTYFMGVRSFKVEYR